MKLLTLTKEKSGVDYHRILLPLKYLKLSEGDKIISFTNRTMLLKSFFRDVDLVLFSRECPFNFDQILEFKKELNFKLIVDIDDYWHLYPGHILYSTWKSENTADQILKSLKNADFITTTHKYLKDKIKAIVDVPVEILPNAFPFGEEQFTDTKVDLNNIIYSCGITHLEDLKTLRRFFELCKQNGDIQKYTFCVAGYNSTDAGSLEVWRKIEREAKLFGNYQMWSTLSLEKYMNHYTYGKISIAPLEDNEFNRCKSNLKLLEAGCKNIPMLASDMHPYNEMSGVLLCKTQRDWYNNLKMLIRSPEKIQEYGEILGNYVRNNFNLFKINEYRKHLYDQWAMH